MCLLVLTNTYARFYGVARGLSTVTLAGEGWAVGVLFTPAAGARLLGGPVTAVTDAYRELDQLGADDPLRALYPLVTWHDVRRGMASDPHSPEAHRAAVRLVERRLRAYQPVDADGLLVNRIVDWLAGHPEVTRVDEVADEFGLS